MVRLFCYILRKAIPLKMLENAFYFTKIFLIVIMIIFLFLVLKFYDLKRKLKMVKLTSCNGLYKMINYVFRESQKQASGGVLEEKVFWKYATNKVINKVILHGFSPVNLLHISRTPFSKNTPVWLLLEKLR